MMNNYGNYSLGELVQDDYRKADILEEFHIDFCCGGKKTLKDACRESAVDLTKVIQRFDEMPDSNGGMLDVDYLEVDQLCDYIERKHHSYVRKNVPILTAYLDKVYAAHGRAHPELASVMSLFGEVAHELSTHMEREETILFPLIRELAGVNKHGLNSSALSGLPTIEGPVKKLMQEHDQAGGRFREIAAITNHYEPPRNACNTYRVMLAKLKEFERDLHMHVHLENNVLFPKAEKIGNEINELSD